jgi:hypothetical protein
MVESLKDHEWMEDVGDRLLESRIYRWCHNCRGISPWQWSNVIATTSLSDPEFVPLLWCGVKSISAMKDYCKNV